MPKSNLQREVNIPPRLPNQVDWNLKDLNKPNKLMISSMKTRSMGKPRKLMNPYHPWKDKKKVGTQPPG
jgi:hypothetical protein